MAWSFQNIPEELKQLKQWVCWNIDIIDDKPRKVPYNPNNGKNAQSNNEYTWANFDTALEAMKKYGFEGVGFMFANGYFGVDIDHCLDNDQYKDLIDEFVYTLQSYTEISPSGTGIHIICKGTLPDGARRRGNVEMYQSGRFFTVTGDLYDIDFCEINECTETIKLLHAKYLGQPTPPPSVKKTFTALNMDDNDIIERARRSKNGDSFSNLYSGNWQGAYSSQSEADLAFCNMLAFYTQCNKSQMDRIFRSSGLYRDKWDVKHGANTYGEMTINKAVSDCRQVYEPQAIEEKPNIVEDFLKNVVSPSPHKKHYDMTDSGNAKRLRDKFFGKIKYSFVNKKWYFWNDKFWEVDYSGQIKRFADDVIKDLKIEAFEEEDSERQTAMIKFANKTANSHAKESMIKECQHLDDIPVLPQEMDKEIGLFNCQNGIIDLRNGKLMKHDSLFMQSKIGYSEYSDTAKPPELWNKFLNDVTNGDKDLQRYLQKCVGYSLSGSTREQCAFFLYGMGNNGKSTFLDIISDIMGTYAANVQPETIMIKRSDNNGANTDIARLKSVRFVTSEEPSEGVRLNEGLVKQLTGGGRVTARFLYGEEFEYAPEFKIWIATNHKPVIRGTDVGIWRRIRLIPFEVNIPKDKVDKNMKYKLRKELPQILKWAVDGCVMWQAEGLEPPKAVEDATKEYKNEMDILATFCEACITIDNNSDHKIPANSLFNIYQVWATTNNEYVMTSRKFFLEIKNKIPEKKRAASGYFYPGIALTDYAKTFSPRTYKAEDFKNGVS